MKRSVGVGVALSVTLFVFASPQAAEVTPMTLAQRKAVMNLPGMCSLNPATRWDEAIVTGNVLLCLSL